MRKHVILLIIFSFFLSGCLKPVEENEVRKGNVIFLHPDGTGLAGWNALRILDKGPDGNLNWDSLPNIGLYRSHTKNTLTTSSNAGATMHAYGKKVVYDSYGMDGEEELTALSGKKMSIMMEAKSAGMAIGIVNSGSIIEPGTGVFVASDTKRKHSEAITEKIMKSGAEVIMSGGEEWMLPEGTQGKFGEGRRTDGKNLINYMIEHGYTVVYNRDELLSIPDSTTKLFGVFARVHTFNDQSEEEQRELGLENYNPDTPSLSEMTKAAIDVLNNSKKQFFLVVEEEATDNFANHNNANGFLTALKRADDAIGTVQEYLKEDPNTLLLVASDSEASGPEVLGYKYDSVDSNYTTPANEPGGAAVDGVSGTGTKLFYSQPDQFGNRLPFHIIWSSYYDLYGSVVVRADGINSEMVKGKVDNTDIYRIMYATLFGKILN
ncbi:MAG: alkaline phosphatase [Melioribacteraceae bacterium]|nr:alkaline phosphatase [Melioribacteraceae bacterium]